MSDKDEAAYEAWVGRAKEQDILATAIRYGASLKRVGNEWVGPCPHCGGRDRFGINTNKGVFICRGAGGGDSIGLAMHVAGLSFLEAVEELTGEPPPRGKAKPLSDEQKAERGRLRKKREAEQRSREEEEDRRRAARADTAAGIWECCVPIAGTLAEKYLIGRGIPVPPMNWPEQIGFAAEMPYWLDENREKACFPALVGRIQDIAGDTIAVQAVYLSPDGRKIGREPNKLTFGPMAGGAVRLGGIAEHIHICEGMETGLAIRWLTGFNRPVWATLGTSGLSGIELPIAVRVVMVYPDGDKDYNKKDDQLVPAAMGASLKAAWALRERLSGTGVEIHICDPPVTTIRNGKPVGRDFLDVWVTSLKYEERAA
jgi:phage/plasmid primase-like uncharacterized protein